MGGRVLTQRRRGAECAKKAWPVVRIGDVGTITRGSGIKRSETVERGRPCLRYGEIYTSFNVILDKPKSFVPQEVFDRSVHIKHGDLVFTLTGENTEEIAKTLAYLGDEEIAAGGDLAVWANHGYDPMYLAYLMYSPALIKAKADASNGQIIVHASVRKIQDIQIPIPPLSVQREIVARLEKELGEADALAAKFKEIAENADAEFKAELDETFKNVEGEKVRLGDVCEIERGRSKTRPRNSPELFGGPYPFVQTGDVKKANGGTIISYTQTYSEKGLRQSRLWKKGTLCVTIAANIGEAALLGFDACFPDSVVGITSKGTLSLDFLNYYFYATKSKLFKVAPGTAQKNFNVERLSHVEIVMPKMEQQHEAITKLHMVKAKCEKLKAAAERGLRAAEDLRKAILAEAFEQ